MRRRRLAQRYKQKDLANGIGYKDIASIFLIEKGKVAALDIVILKRISDFLEYPLDKLLTSVE